MHESIKYPVPVSLEDQLYDFVFAYDAAFERAAQDIGLSGAQACLLVQIGRGSRTMGQLAADLVCDASNVSQLVRRLESRGLVVREPDPEDRRTRRVSITDAGRETSRAVEKRFTLPAERIGRLAKAEREQLSRLLAKASRPEAGAEPTG
jgi:DNA-binding MarR family transcriptional regulator